VDINGGGVNGTDNGVLTSVTMSDGTVVNLSVIAGKVDLNRDGSIDVGGTTDDGYFMGFPVLDGLIDVDGGGISGTDNTTLLGRYDFTQLPAGTYFTTIDKYDSDIQTTYGITTLDQMKGVLASGTPVAANLNYGFAPPLSIVKSLVTTGTININRLVRYNIILKNNLPGGYGSGNSCTFDIWAKNVHWDNNPSGVQVPGGGATAAKFDQTSSPNITGAPDGKLAQTNLSSATNLLGVDGFNADSALLAALENGATVTKVESVLVGTEIVNMNGGYIAADIWHDGNGSSSTAATTYTYQTAGTQDTASGFFGSYYPGQYFEAVHDITTLQHSAGPPVVNHSWGINDFRYDNLGMQIKADKGGGSSSGNVGFDAAGIRVTINQPCANPGSTTLNPVPLHDAFPTTYLDYLYSIPPEDTFSESGGTIDWNNVGPIPAGTYKKIEVYFKATATTPSTQYNTASSNDPLNPPKFSDGRVANLVTADAPLDVSATTNSGSISGVVFNDKDSDGWVFSAACTPGTGTTCGLDTSPSPGDAAISGVKVTLLACLDNTGALVTDQSPGNKLCSALPSNPTWEIYRILYTDSNGYYNFQGLPTGYYRVRINDGVTLPGSTATADPAVTSGTCSGSCDFQSYPDLRLDQITFGMIPTAGATITNVNFGFHLGTTSRAIGDEVYYDWDGDGVRDYIDADNSGTYTAGDTYTDEIIPGVHVMLFGAGGVSQIGSDAVTDSSQTHPYSFSVVDGTYTVIVDTSTLPTGVSLTQTADPTTTEAGARCDHCDNQVTYTVNGADHYELDFGYQPTGTVTIGDTVYKDLNGDGVQSGPLETGIPNITVNLLVDLDGNGTWVPVRTTTTDASGKYLFTVVPNLPSGKAYQIQVNTADADLPKDGFGKVYTATNGSVYTNITVSGSLGGRIDFNGDGFIKNDGTDTGTITISSVNYAVINGGLDINANGWIDSGDDFTNITGAIDVYDGYLDLSNNGTVGREDVSATYGTIGGKAVIVSDNLVTSMTNSFSGVISTSPNGFGDSLEADPLNLDADFGFAPLAAIGDTVYWDSNGNGTQDFQNVAGTFVGEPGINGTRVWLFKFVDAMNGVYDSGEAFVDNNGNGFYDAGDTFTDAYNRRYDPGEYFFTDTNGDGIRQSGETQSTDPFSVTEVSYTTTATSNGQDGRYLFSGLDTTLIGYGYAVVVETRIGQTGTMYGYQLTGDPNNDGVPCPASPPVGSVCDSREGVKLYPGSSYMGADFGYKPSNVIGDTVWMDANGNGIRDYTDSDNDGTHDPDEPYTEAGIPNVTVTRYVDANNDGIRNAGENTSLGTTTTDADGLYFFTNVSNGNFVLVLSNLPSGLAATYDPDGTLNGETAVKVASNAVSQVGTCTNTAGCDSPIDSDPLNLDADFGYKYSGTAALSGTICLEMAVASQNGWCGAADTTNNGVDTTPVSGVPSESAYTSVSVFLVKWADADTDGNIDAGETVEAGSTSTFAYRVINGYLDIDGDGVTNGDAGDAYTDFYGTVDVIGGLLNMDGDLVTAGDLGDDGGYLNFAVIDGYLDIDGDGITNGDAGDAIRVGDYAFVNLPNAVYYIVAIGAPQEGVIGTSDASTVNSGSGDSNLGNTNNTVTLSITKAADGVTALSAYQVVDLRTATIVYDRDFAFKPATVYDFGDAPQSFATLNPGGPHNAMPTGGYTIWLGVNPPDTEADAALPLNAASDGADEDGLTIPPPVSYGANSTWTDGDGGVIQVTVSSSTSGGSGWLVGYFDLNHDGTFDDANEMIISQSVSATTLAGGIYSTTYTFTLSSLKNLLPSSTYYMRLRMLPSQPQFATTSFVGEVTNGETEDFIITTDVPVTLSYFLAQRHGSKVDFTWSTATETGNLGFNLYVETEDGQLLKINDQIIFSNTTDSLSRQDYSFNIDMAGETFYIEDVSLRGETAQYGPFQLGEPYGSQGEEDKIDGPAIAAENSQKHDQQQAKLKSNLKVPAAALQAPTLSSGGNAFAQLTDATLNLKVNKTGLYRVTYEMLRDAGLDLLNVPQPKITLTNLGKIVPIYVESQGRFGPGSFIEFYGTALDTLYTSTNIYTVQVIQTSAPRVATNTPTPVKNEVPPASYVETLTVNNQRLYSYYGMGKDPWYDTRMLAANTPVKFDFPFQVNDLASSSTPATLELTVWGMLNLDTNPDHHLLVSLNGVALADQKFEGLVEHVIKATLPAGALREGSNTLTLTVPGDLNGPYDLIYMDKFSVSYPRFFKAQEGRLTFSAVGGPFNVTNLPSANVIVYRLDDAGITRMNGVKVSGSGSNFTASFAGSKLPATYMVTTAGSFYAPVLEATRVTAANLDQPAQYLIISHPDFIAGLQPLVQARQAQGLTVNIVDVNDLYTRYNYGIFDPLAIKQYIAYAAKNLGVQYVLLVGGDTYDYRNFLGVNSISFIPSLYIRTADSARFVPVDPLYADINDDNVPDLAIGRFPVRSTAELNMMINKTLAYSAKSYGRTAVFATDKDDGTASFENASNSLSAPLAASGWSVQNIHLNKLTVAVARTQLLASMNKGTSLVNFSGHSAPTTWTASGLFNPTYAKNLTNAGKPFVTVQWGCWNTYYVDPVNNYLVQTLLFSGDKGAAAVLGATTISNFESERMLSLLFMPRLTAPGMTMGMALRDAKIEMAQTAKPLDVLLGWTLIGDPALIVAP
jgi:hypothetical protein